MTCQYASSGCNDPEGECIGLCMKTVYFGSWRCNCTNVQPTKEAISTRCPTHGSELLGPVKAVLVNASTEYGLKEGGTK